MGFVTRNTGQATQPVVLALWWHLLGVRSAWHWHPPHAWPAVLVEKMCILQTAWVPLSRNAGCLLGLTELVWSGCFFSSVAGARAGA